MHLKRQNLPATHVVSTQQFLKKLMKALRRKLSQVESNRRVQSFGLPHR